MIQCLSVCNPPWNSLYEQICKDRGIVPRGDAQHRLMILEKMFSGEAWKVKGDKVSLGRWFSWLKAADLYLPLWHQGFLVLVGYGQAMGVYKTSKDVPLWNPKTLKKSDIEDDTREKKLMMVTKTKIKCLLA